MERILIVGCPGAGKSTLAREMAQKMGIPLIHLDQLFWLPGWKEREKEEFDTLLQTELKKPKWIIDGNYGRTLPLRLTHCDTVIFLDFSSLACVMGVLKRVLTTRGKVRPDMGDGCPERLDWSFLRYVWRFRRTQRNKIAEKISLADPSVARIVLRNRRQVRNFVQKI